MCLYVYSHLFILNFVKFRADTKSFFESELNATTTDNDHIIQMRKLLERCNGISLIIDQRVNVSHDQSHGDGDNSSYLDMSIRKPDAEDEVNAIIDEINELARSEYVDVSQQIDQICCAESIGMSGDENDNNDGIVTIADDAVNENNDDDGSDDDIYDNYTVEKKSIESTHNSNSKSNGNEYVSVTDAAIAVDGKRDCPFGGLPAAHLTIKKAHRIGWLILNYRRRPFLSILNSYLSKKFYVGLLCDTIQSGAPDWWMLMYSGMTQMKPTICIELRRFQLVRVASKKRIRERCPDAGVDIKFELHERLPSDAKKKATPIVYQFSATTSDDCDQWCSSLLLLMNNESLRSICSTTAHRKLPMLPPHECSEMSENAPNGHHQDGHNCSEGVYEEPEEYYRHIANASTLQPESMPEIVCTYDVPKSPARPVQTTEEPSPVVDHSNHIPKNLREMIDSCTVDNADDYDKVIVDSLSSSIASHPNRMKINDIRLKLTSHFKEHSLLPVSSTGSRKTSIVDCSADDKTQQVSSVRKFVSQLARMKHKSTKSPKPMKRDKKSNPTKVSIATSDASPPVSQTTTKQNKVHMIINQLEANGQLTLLSGGGGGSVGAGGTSGYYR